MSNVLPPKSTKIVATIGPASWEPETLRAMIRAGVNVARINFSHGNHERHAKTFETVRRVAKEERAVIAILSDIQGPKIRIGQIPDMHLSPGEQVTLTLEDISGHDHILPLPHPEFVKDIYPGNTLLLDDGKLEFRVTDRTSTSLICEVVIGGPLTSRKGIMSPDADLSLSAITPKDREDIEFALAHRTDYIAMSFVRNADDIRKLRWVMKNLYDGDAAVIAKIEKHEALENIQEIIDVSEGIMVARGDLGIETPAEEVPYHQKRIIKLCNEIGKPVITATQMLSSMEFNPRPTRAEASDVYNAIIDGTDAVMLSNESATGKYPVRAVEVMTEIAKIAEKHIHAQTSDRLPTLSDRKYTIPDTISEATFHIARILKPKAIVTISMSGYTTFRVAKERPRALIFCMTPNENTYHRMALAWGVLPILVPEFNTIDEMIRIIERTALDANLVEKGEILVITAGVPFGYQGQTNLLKVHTVGDAGEI